MKIIYFTLLFAIQATANTVSINGKTYNGNSVSIINGRVSIDGKMEPNTVNGVVEVKVSGDLASLKTDANVTVNGNVRGNVEAGGTVQATTIRGNASAGGTVSADVINGSATAGGIVQCRK